MNIGNLKLNIALKPAMSMNALQIFCRLLYKKFYQMKYPLITACCLMIVWSTQAQLMPKNTNVIIANENYINSDKLEYSPAFAEDGLVFITTESPGVKYNVLDKRINKNIMSIYYSVRDTNGILGEPDYFTKDILSVFHDGPLSFDRLGQTMFFTRNNNKNGKLVKSNDGIAKLKIYQADKVGDRWDNIVELPFNDDESNTLHPSMSVDGKFMIFSSDREGGSGGMDLYMVKRLGDDWDVPVNLGPAVNSDKNDVFPYLGADGTLYFSSTRTGGSGSLDIYFSKNVNDTWTAPVNMNSPFNGPWDDFGFIVDRDKKNGYFSSNRPGGQGEDDIYSFFASGKGLEDDLFHRDLMLYVSDELTGELLENVEVIPLNLDELSLTNSIVDSEGNVIRLQSVTGEDDNLVVKLSIEDSEQRGYTNTEGEYPLRVTNHNYVIKLSKEGYQTKEILISERDSETEIYALLGKAVDCVTLNGTVRNKAYGAPVGGATATIVEQGTEEEVKVTSDTEGKFKYCLECGTLYSIRISKSGYNTDFGSISTENVTCTSSNTLNYEAVLEGGKFVLEEGSVIELANIYYNFNDASIRPDARVDLQALGSIMKRFPAMTIELRSHTDSRGTDDYNRNLSQRRADNVVNHLTAKGIDKARMTAVGYGESQLRNECTDGVSCSEEDHQYNRRTEFRVVSIGSNVEVKYLDNPPSNTSSISDAATTSSVSFDELAGSSNFLVIAGTFGIAENARLQLNRVRNLGYTNAKLISFNDKNLHAVCVGTFDSKSNAESLERELSRVHRIDTYIKEL